MNKSIKIMDINSCVDCPFSKIKKIERESEWNKEYTLSAYCLIKSKDINIKLNDINIKLNENKPEWCKLKEIYGIVEEV